MSEHHSSSEDRSVLNTRYKARIPNASKNKSILVFFLSRLQQKSCVKCAGVLILRRRVTYSGIHNYNNLREALLKTAIHVYALAALLGTFLQLGDCRRRSKYISNLSTDDLSYLRILMISIGNLPSLTTLMEAARPSCKHSLTRSTNFL